jgi:hypothetical protein
MKKRHLLHEIQHVIQFQEGFARGGSPSEFSDRQNVTPEIEEYKKTLADLREKNRDIEIEASLSDDYVEIILQSDSTITKEQRDKASVEYQKLEDRATEKWGEDWKTYTSTRAELHIAERLTGTESASQQYRRLAGEIEARDSAIRGDLTASQRAEEAPNLRDDAIVIFGGEQVAAMSLEPVVQRDPKYAEQQAKFDAAPAAEVTGEEVADFSQTVNMKTARKSAISWAQKNGLIRSDYQNKDNIKHDYIERSENCLRGRQRQV